MGFGICFEEAFCIHKERVKSDTLNRTGFKYEVVLGGLHLQGSFKLRSVWLSLSFCWLLYNLIGVFMASVTVRQSTSY